MSDREYAALVAEVKPITSAALASEDEAEIEAALERCCAIIAERHAQSRRARGDT